jgi:hypothetical protein
MAKGEAYIGNSLELFAELPVQTPPDSPQKLSDESG